MLRCREASCGAVYHKRCMLRWMHAQPPPQRSGAPPPPPGTARCVLCTHNSVWLRDSAAGGRERRPGARRVAVQPLRPPPVAVAAWVLDVSDQIRRDPGFREMTRSLRRDAVNGIMDMPEMQGWHPRHRAQLVRELLG